jgi:hypothetical protein
VVAVAPPAEPASPPEATATPAVDPTTAPPAAVPTVEPTGERITAKAGVGKKGQSLQEHTGVLVEPLKAFIRVEQRKVFEIQIPQALSLFQASEGRKPKSHEEFMTKIVAPNNIKLPTLPEGETYVYDPERGELMVQKPPR